MGTHHNSLRASESVWESLTENPQPLHCQNWSWSWARTATALVRGRWPSLASRTIAWTVSPERLCKQLLPFWFHNWSRMLALHPGVTQLIPKTWMSKTNSRVHLQIKLSEDLRPSLRILWLPCRWTRSAPRYPTIPRALTVSESAACKDENRS